MSYSVIEHPNTHLALEQLGKVYHPYRKTIPFEGDFIDDAHRALSLSSERGMLKGGITGSLREADALKIYELAYFSGGNILELGTFHGLSASIIATAMRNSGSKHSFVSVDNHKRSSELGHTNLTSLDLSKFASFETADGTSFLNRMTAEGRHFGFVFVDHSHTYEHVRDTCKRLPAILLPNGYVLFHDFNDPRNADPAVPAMGVYQGVVEGLSNDRFRFCGTYGCTALYRFVSH